KNKIFTKLTPDDRAKLLKEDKAFTAENPVIFLPTVQRSPRRPENLLLRNYPSCQPLHPPLPQQKLYQLPCSPRQSRRHGRDYPILMDPSPEQHVIGMCQKGGHVT